MASERLASMLKVEVLSGIVVEFDGCATISMNGKIVTVLYQGEEG